MDKCLSVQGTIKTWLEDPMRKLFQRLSYHCERECWILAEPAAHHAAWSLASQHYITLGAELEAKNVFPTSATSDRKWESKRLELQICSSNKLLESKDVPRVDQK
jgi:hypothetical protein